MVFPKSSLRVNPVRVVPITTRLTAPSPNPLYPLTFYLTKEKKMKRKRGKKGVERYIRFSLRGSERSERSDRQLLDVVIFF